MEAPGGAVSHAGNLNVGPPNEAWLDWTGNGSSCTNLLFDGLWFSGGSSAGVLMRSRTPGHSPS